MAISANYQGFQAVKGFDTARITEADFAGTSKLVKGKTSRFGRAVTWIRSKVQPGKVSAENNRVMQSFVASVEAEHAGKGAVARAVLGDTSKNLTSMKIQLALNAVEIAVSSEQLIDDLTQEIATQSGESFDSLLLNAKAHTRIYAPPNDLDWGQISRDVRQALEDEAPSRPLGLGQGTAHHIALSVIKEHFVQAAG